jgi:hypothetical protein
MKTHLFFGIALTVASVFLNGITYAQDAQKPNPEPCILPPLASNPRAVESFTLKAGQHFRTKSGIDFTAPKILKKPTTFSISEVPLEKLFSYPGGLKTTHWTNQNARAYKITASPEIVETSDMLFEIRFPIPEYCFVQNELLAQIRKPLENLEVPAEPDFVPGAMVLHSMPQPVDNIPKI